MIASKNEQESILVNNWVFVENVKKEHEVTLDGVTYAYRNAIYFKDRIGKKVTFTASMNANKYLFPPLKGEQGVDVDGNKRTGLPGQNTTNPKSIFSDHEVVQVDGVIYDPSYGVKYEGETEAARLQKMEAVAIAGYARVHVVKGKKTVVYLQIRKKTGDGLKVKLRTPGM